MRISLASVGMWFVDRIAELFLFTLLFGIWFVIYLTIVKTDDVSFLIYASTSFGVAFTYGVMFSILTLYFLIALYLHFKRVRYDTNHPFYLTWGFGICFAVFPGIYTISSVFSEADWYRFFLSSTLPALFCGVIVIRLVARFSSRFMDGRDVFWK